MLTSCVIRHPGHGCHLELVNKPDGYHFAAAGIADSAVPVASAKLFQTVGGATAPVGQSGTVFRKGAFWVLPYTLPAGFALPVAALYNLTIYNPGGNVIACSRNIRITQKPPPARGGIEINSPTDNATVCPDFQACGTTDGAGAMTATLATANGTVIANGNFLQGPPATSQWIFAFGGLWAGMENLILTVTQAAVPPAPAPAPATVGGLVVAGCAEISPGTIPTP
jgi:hypothetical protein